MPIFDIIKQIPGDLVRAFAPIIEASGKAIVSIIETATGQTHKQKMQLFDDSRKKAIEKIEAEKQRILQGQVLDTERARIQKEAETAIASINQQITLARMQLLYLIAQLETGANMVENAACAAASILKTAAEHHEPASVTFSYDFQCANRFLFQAAIGEAAIKGNVPKSVDDLKGNRPMIQYIQPKSSVTFFLYWDTKTGLMRPEEIYVVGIGDASDKNKWHQKNDFKLKGLASQNNVYYLLKFVEPGDYQFKYKIKYKDCDDSEWLPAGRAREELGSSNMHLTIADSHHYAIVSYRCNHTVQKIGYRCDDQWIDRELTIQGSESHPLYSETTIKSFNEFRLFKQISDSHREWHPEPENHEFMNLHMNQML